MEATGILLYARRPRRPGRPRPTPSSSSLPLLFEKSASLALRSSDLARVLSPSQKTSRFRHARRCSPFVSTLLRKSLPLLAKRKGCCVSLQRFGGHFGFSRVPPRRESVSLGVVALWSKNSPRVPTVASVLLFAQKASSFLSSSSFDETNPLFLLLLSFSRFSLRATMTERERERERDSNKALLCCTRVW